MTNNQIIMNTISNASQYKTNNTIQTWLIVGGLLGVTVGIIAAYQYLEAQKENSALKLKNRSLENGHKFKDKLIASQNSELSKANKTIHDLQ